MRPLLRGTLVAAAVASVLAPPAAARPDGSLRPYLKHLSQLRLGWPAEGTITDGFGPRWGRMHNGLDIGILRAPDVWAAAPGQVLATGYMVGYEGYGNVVLVDIGEGYATLYAHLSETHVFRGNWIGRGHRLGLAGCTGSCTGTHLHFELHQNGRPIDPRPFLPASGP
jgi:murein DD-endopeptidase MepM/ murein hydrolase activator NlpD